MWLISTVDLCQIFFCVRLSRFGLALRLGQMSQTRPGLELCVLLERLLRHAGVAFALTESAFALAIFPAFACIIIHDRIFVVLGVVRHRTYGRGIAGMRGLFLVLFVLGSSKGRPWSNPLMTATSQHRERQQSKEEASAQKDSGAHRILQRDCTQLSLNKRSKEARH